MPRTLATARTNGSSGFGCARRGLGRLGRVSGAAAESAWDAAVLARTGLLFSARPDRLARAAWQLLRWDATLAGGCAIAAAMHPDAPATVDERRTVTFAQLHRRTNALARGLAAQGIKPGESVAILCRNHSGPVEALLAASKLGADVTLLNAGLSPATLRAAIRRGHPAAVVYDEEFGEAVKLHGRPRVLAWHEPGADAEFTLDELIAGYPAADLAPPVRHGRLVLQTSGTTGIPKGVMRPESSALSTPLALLDRIPLRTRRRTLIAPPLFHSWGYLQFALALAVRATIILQRRFDPEAVLAAVDRERVDTLVLVPTMLTRILELERSVRRRYDASSLRVVVVSGSALPADAAGRFMNEFGD
ncbi:MAG: AMP-binding protein, partial [Solirubrobacteraceae bacterium]